MTFHLQILLNLPLNFSFFFGFTIKRKAFKHWVKSLVQFFILRALYELRIIASALLMQFASRRVNVQEMIWSWRIEITTVIVIKESRWISYGSWIIERCHTWVIHAAINTSLKLPSWSKLSLTYNWWWIKVF